MDNILMCMMRRGVTDLSGTSSRNINCIPQRAVSPSIEQVNQCSYQQPYRNPYPCASPVHYTKGNEHTLNISGKFL
uniref:Cationic amino acid transporter 4 vacuolar-like isoform X2 n=1 Tax=Rhizophora mucronata TaxID=61149 RepID=A0A2P2IW60_RHIMU